MHDEWLYSGHCAYTLDSERWLDGCGSCPHLDSYPALRVDGTAGNWRRKAALYERSQLHVVCPSEWLLERAQRSMLAPAIASVRVIPNGVDFQLFAPQRRDVRDELVVVFAAQGARTNPYKDFTTLRQALELLRDRQLMAIALGEGAPEERIGSVTLRSEPFLTREEVAKRLRGADLYVHATKADNHPLAVLEALACGVPVIASRVGGIPEQLTEETGLLVEPNDAQSLAASISELLGDPDRRTRMGAAAAADARARFSLERQVASYLDLYSELC
jgi:glycosyltransferase involved in cell wall biosynthesis